MEVKTNLLKITPETTYFANNNTLIADSETFVITEDHTISDILRYLVTVSDISELKFLLDNL